MTKHKTKRAKDALYSSKSDAEAAIAKHLKKGSFAAVADTATGGWRIEDRAAIEAAAAKLAAEKQAQDAAAKLAQEGAQSPLPKDYKPVKSVIQSPVKAVWTMATEMNKRAAETGTTCKRKDVVEACVRAGIAFYTARTQYQAWLTAGGIKATPVKTAPAPLPSPEVVEAALRRYGKV